MGRTTDKILVTGGGGGVEGRDWEGEEVGNWMSDRVAWRSIPWVARNSAAIFGMNCLVDGRQY